MQENMEALPQTEPSIKTVGIVSAGLENPFDIKLLNELTRQLNARGCRTLLINVTPAEEYRGVLQQAGRLDGLVLLSSAGQDVPAAAAAIAPATPIVTFGSQQSEDVAIIATDGQLAGAEVGRLLLQQGHQRFGYLQGQAESPVSAQCRASYADSLETGGKALDQVITADGCDRDLACQTVLTYLKRTRAAERIDALFCDSDVLAFGAMQAIRDFGQGAHVAVVGMGDVAEAGASTWHLTSWSPRCDLLVTEALNRLLENRTDRSGAWQQGELQIRHSHHGKAIPGEMSLCGCASRH